MKNRVAVIGGGSWATAIVKMLCNGLADGEKIAWWIRNPEQSEYIAKFRHNPKYLSAVEFDVNKLALSNDIREVIANNDLLIMAVPSAFLADSLAGLAAEDFRNKIVFSAIKGIIPGANLIVGEYFNQHYGVPYSHIGVITGPCHAEEVALEDQGRLCDRAISGSGR